MKRFSAAVTLLLVAVFFGFVVASIKLSGESDTLGLLPVAFVFFTARYAAMSFGILLPVAILLWCFVPSAHQPPRSARPVFLAVAFLVSALTIAVAVPELRRAFFRQRVHEGRLSSSDMAWLYAAGSRDALWQSRTIQIIASESHTPDWVFRSLADHNSTNNNFLIRMANNPNCPHDVLVRLTQHSDFETRSAASKRLQQP